MNFQSVFFGPVPVTSTTGLVQHMNQTILLPYSITRRLRKPSLSSLDSSCDADSQGNVNVENVKATTITVETKTKTERLPRAEKVDMLDNTPSPTPQRKTDKLRDISDKKQASTKKTESPVKDIGLFYDKINQMSDAEKFDLLQNVWKPQQDFPDKKFPSKLETGGKTRKFCYNWLLTYPWLVYS